MRDLHPSYKSVAVLNIKSHWELRLRDFDWQFCNDGLVRQEDEVAIHQSVLESVSPCALGAVYWGGVYFDDSQYLNNVRHL
jgi:hypothetical protein